MALSIAAILLTLTVVLASPVEAQISPGPLSNAHRELSGTSGCVKCHAVSPGSPSFRCLDCHQDIASRLKQGRGLHPALVGHQDPNASCVRCHSEHNGEKFSLVRWDPTPGKFDHAKTGFTLDGKHAALACQRCHNPERIVAAERATLSARDLKRTYLGLSKSCASCHEDKHRGQLGANCLQCHNTTDWKAAVNFDHSKTRFKLTGAHRELACQKCHTPLATGVLQYSGLKFDRCTSCHNDVHRGAFAQDCQSCHNTGQWRRTLQTFQFDHGKTRYVLTGKHLELQCESCHRGGDFKKPLAHGRCADCHTPDPHRGQFAGHKDAGACESCHTTVGFKNANFGLAEHNATGFPLREKHATLACAKCHVPAGRDTIFKIKFAQCLDCHQDAHRNQFAGAPNFNRCQACHTETTFRPATMTLARHQQIHALTGSHLAVACSDCHKPLAGSRVAAYHFANLSCTSCHEDPHRGQFSARMSRIAANGQAQGCLSCHNTKTWQDVTKFDHAGTRFKLTGAHRAAVCADCHRPPNLERSLKNVNFTSTPLQCQACHTDPHAAQFAVAGNTSCADCHNSTRWRPSLFDHEKTSFSLRGGHQNVRCSACHVSVRQVNDKSVLFYKPVPFACAACHGDATLSNTAQRQHR